VRRQDPQQNLDLVLTVSEAAKLLKVSENHLYSLISQDLVPHLRFGKLIRIPYWGLVQFIATASGTPAPANLDVAIWRDQSVHVQQPNSEEAGDVER
jgi:excisionase family DNA binding protein